MCLTEIARDTEVKLTKVMKKQNAAFIARGIIIINGRGLNVVPQL